MTSDPQADALARLASIIGTSSGQRDHLTTLREGIPYHTGSVAPVIGENFRSRRSGLIAPSRLPEQPHPYDNVELFITTQDYSEEDPRSVSEHILKRHDPLELLFALVALNRISAHESQEPVFAEAYASSLPAVPQRRFRAALAAPRSNFLARQPLLMATMVALSGCTHTVRSLDRTPDMDTLKAAVMLTHSLAAGLGSRMAEMDADPNRIGGVSASAVMYLSQNAMFNESQDPVGTLVATDSLWNQYASRTVKYVPDPTAAEELTLALGMPVDEFTSLTRGLYAMTIGWKPDEPLAIQSDLGMSSLPQDVASALLSAVSLPMEEFAAKAATMRGEWNFLVLEQFPVLDLGDDCLLVLDANYLLQRTTSELWRYVTDIKTGRSGTPWRQFYAEAFEMMIEDQLRLLAPQDLSSGQVYFFTEEEFQEGYSGKACDAAICYGDDWLLFEIETARLTLRARQLDDAEAFVADTRKIVEKKSAQLDQTATRLLRGLSSLISGLPSSASRIFPIIVVPDAYPRWPTTVRLVNEILDEHHRLRDPRIQPLVILSRSDIDTLEAMLGEGESPVDILAAWLGSSLAETDLWNFIYATYGVCAARRPQRVSEAFHTTFDKALEFFQSWGMQAEDAKLPEQSSEALPGMERLPDE